MHRYSDDYRQASLPILSIDGIENFYTIKLDTSNCYLIRENQPLFRDSWKRNGSSGGIRLLLLIKRALSD